jgi:PAS domain S-box-containing protein
VRDDDGQVAGLFCACTETTAQVMSDRKLLESEENHRAVVEGARDYAIFTTDAAGTIKSWSPGAQAVFGWTADEAVGRDAGLIFTPEDLAADRHRVELRTAAEEGCANDERWHIRKDGSRVFMNGSMRPLTGAAGEPRGFIKVARDETDRRAVFEALARSEARARDLAAEQGRLAEIIRQTPDFVGVADPEGRPLFVNEAGLRMVGLPDMAAARATRMVDYHRPEEAQRLATTVVPAAVQQGVWEGELAFRRFDDGREIPVQGRLFAIKDESGAVTSLASILSDVTERKVADAALRAQELQTRDVLEGMAEAYVLMDEAFRIRDINAEGLRIDGRPRGEIVGRHLLEVWPESEHLPTWPLFQRVMAKGSAEELTYRHRSDLHDIWLEVRAHPSLGGVAAFYRDVTERKAAERAVQESEVRLRTLTDAIPAFVWFADPDGRSPTTTPVGTPTRA